MLALVCAVAGLAVGVLLNTVVDRVPDRAPLRPLASPCGACGAAPASVLAPSAGRCRGCGAARPLSEQLVPVGTAVLFAAAGMHFGTTLVLVPYLVLFAALVAVTAIDIACFRIPDRIVFPTLALSVPLVVAVSLRYDSPAHIGYALAGAAVYFTLLFVPHLIYPKGMGFGDVKLALVMGLYIGWLGVDYASVVYLVFVALMAGCVLGIGVSLLSRLLRGSGGEFPFGPGLALSTVLVVLFSDDLIRNYLGV